MIAHKHVYIILGYNETRRDHRRIIKQTWGQFHLSIPIPPNSIWSIPIPIPHQIYQFQFQFQFQIDQFQFNSVYIFLYNLCKIFLIHLLFYYLAIYWYVCIIIHIAIYSIYMNTYIQTNNMFMMLRCVFIRHSRLPAGNALWFCQNFFFFFFFFFYSSATKVSG